MKIVLFLCTGNYYRSRFAGYLFNHLAEKSDLEWRSISRGIAVDLGINNIGLISSHAVQALKARKISLPVDFPSPCQLIISDLTNADLIVAIDESEHRLLLEKRFPGWETRVRYWHIKDVGVLDPAEGCSQMEMQVRALIDEMS